MRKEKIISIMRERDKKIMLRICYVINLIIGFWALYLVIPSNKELSVVYVFLVFLVGNAINFMKTLEEFV